MRGVTKAGMKTDEEDTPTERMTLDMGGTPRCVLDSSDTFVRS